MTSEWSAAPLDATVGGQDGQAATSAWEVLAVGVLGQTSTDPECLVVSSVPMFLFSLSFIYSFIFGLG